MRTAVGPTSDDDDTTLARSGDEVGRVGALDDHDVGVDGRRVDAAGLGQQPGVGVVVGEPVDVVVEGVEPGRGQDPGLPHAAAHPLAPDARLGDRVGGADHERADRGTEALGQADRHDVRDRAVLHEAACRSRRGRSRSAHRPCGCAAPTPVAYSRRSRRSSSGSTAPPAKLWVFSTEIATVGTKNGPMSGAKIDLIVGQVDLPARVDPGPRREPRVGAVRAELRAHDVGARLAEHLLARTGQGAYGEHVAHRAGRDEQRRLVAEHPRHPLLEPDDGRVLAVHVVTDLGTRHRGAHLARSAWSGCRCAGRSPRHPVRRKAVASNGPDAHHRWHDRDLRPHHRRHLTGARRHGVRRGAGR